VIPRWHWVVLLALLMGTVAAALVVFPHSYAHAYLWGECGRPGEPKECHPLGRGFRGPGIRIHP